MNELFAIEIESARNSRAYGLKDNDRVDAEIRQHGRTLVHVTAKLDFQGKPTWEIKALTATGLARIDGGPERDWFSTRVAPRRP